MEGLEMFGEALLILLAEWRETCSSEKPVVPQEGFVIQTVVLLNDGAR
jgi:hypothetical protein